MLKQSLELTLMGLRSLPDRLGTSSLIVVGIGGVVAVLVALLAMSQGFRAALVETGHPDRALVLRTGAADEITSWWTTDEVAIASELPGVSLASGELYVVADLPTRTTGKPGVAIARGLSQAGFALRPELRIVQGRRFEAGRDEIIAGVDAVAAYAGLEIGDEVNVRNHVWTVVGHFDGVGAQDSEVWLDLSLAQAAFRREGAVSSIRLAVAEPAALTAVAAEIDRDPRLIGELVAEREFYRQQSRARVQLIESFAFLVSTIMAVGAVIAAYSTMHAAVRARTVEIATLRALGFQSAPVVASVLLEAMLLAAVGGLLGGGLVYLLYDGYQASTLNAGSLSQIAFQFAVTPTLVLTGLAGALLLGLLGSLAPAIAAVRSGVAEALRAG